MVLEQEKILQQVQDVLQVVLQLRSYAPTDLTVLEVFLLNKNAEYFPWQAWREELSAYPSGSRIRPGLL